MKNLLHGFMRFKRDVYPKQRDLFRRLSIAQTPKALFITCADSRVVPELLTQANPGDLFICRNVGNLVPTYGDTNGGVSAAIEYAIQALKIKNVIICGHSDCGAMKAVLHPEKVADLPIASAWLRHADAARQVVLENYSSMPEDMKLALLIEENIIRQIENLKTHPSVAASLARGQLQIYGWMYNIQSADINAYNANTGSFEPLDETLASATPPPRVRPVAYAGGVS
jgi:carbonic anhydrase